MTQTDMLLTRQLELDPKYVHAIRRAAKEDGMDIKTTLQAAVHDYLEFRRVELNRMEI